MPADVKNGSKPITLWLNTMKATLPHPEDELFAKATIQKKNARKNMSEIKPGKSPNPKKKTCICAPTNHPGSFRCHLHRNSLVAKNSLWSGEENTKELQRKSSFNANNGHPDVVDKPPRLSRFGLAASSRTCQDNFPFSMAEQVN